MKVKELLERCIKEKELVGVKNNWKLISNKFSLHFSNFLFEFCYKNLKEIEFLWQFAKVHQFSFKFI